MAHCGSCKSNLGTGGKRRGTGGLYDVQGVALRSGKATGRAAGANMTPWTTTHATIISSNGKINKRVWIPATSNAETPAGLEAWVYFPGGRKANLRIGGMTQTRYVLAHKNGGPTGVLVRLGDIARDLGTGGCGDLTGLPGTGGATSVNAVNVRSGATWRGTGAASDGIHGRVLEGRVSKQQVANRWFKATYGPRPASNPASWVVLSGPPPGPAELWMAGQGPLHKHDVEVIQVTNSVNQVPDEFNALIAGWSLPHMINDVTYAQGQTGVARRHAGSSYRYYQGGSWPSSGGTGAIVYAQGTAGWKASELAREFLVAEPLASGDCIVVYYGGQGYICCGSGACVSLPITAPDEVELFKVRFPHGARVPYTSLGFRIPQFEDIFTNVRPLLPKYLTM